MDAPSQHLEEIIAAAVQRQVDEQRALQGSLEQVREALHDLRLALEEFREGFGDVRSEVRGLAEVVLELAQRLKERTGELDDRVSGLGSTLLQGLKELASAQQDALGGLGEALAGSAAAVASEVRRAVREALDPLGARLAELKDCLGEVADVVSYLRDQADDFDKVIAGLGDVSRRVEGILAQALKRALTVRAGLLDEATKALEEALAPVERRVAQLADELGAPRPRRRGEEDGLQRLASQLEELRSSVAAWEAERRRREEVLLQAIERLARGGDWAVALEPAEAGPSRSGARGVKRAEKASPPRASERASPPSTRRASEPEKGSSPRAPRASRRPDTEAPRASARRSPAGGGNGGAGSASSRGRGRPRKEPTYIPV